MTNDNIDHSGPVNLARKVMSGAVTELMTAGVHPTHIIDAMLAELETLRVQTRDIDAGTAP